MTIEEYVIESFAFEQLEVFVYDGAAALARSRHSQRGHMGDQDRTQAFLMTDVFAWRAGRWRAVHRHISPLPAG